MYAVPMLDERRREFSSARPSHRYGAWMPDAPDRWFWNTSSSTRMRSHVTRCATGPPATVGPAPGTVRCVTRRPPGRCRRNRGSRSVRQRAPPDDRPPAQPGGLTEPMGDFEPSSVLVDDVSPERWSGGRQALLRLADAFDRLPDRCREVAGCAVEDPSQRDGPCAWASTEKPWAAHRKGHADARRAPVRGDERRGRRQTRT